MPVSVVVEQVEPSRTFQLRQKVLRPHESLEAMSFDADPDSAIFGAIDTATGEVVGTANVRRAPPPDELSVALPADASGLPPWRLRGMATREDLRSQGIGARVLGACTEHVAEAGGGLLWCRARTGARRFYGRQGYSEFGEEYDDEQLGPHVVMWRVVEPTDAGCHGATNAARGAIGKEDE